ncbi:MAG: choice-of-anchor J domain-containing protein [Calditrichaceae bacterium]|nr:choice-of-anchor J domain-containing protein [Calditrichaceae bacterium]MBN2708382.1 choice-of-anchor J domain-containing protein [Calditrichaceae bacterium]
MFKTFLFLLVFSFFVFAQKAWINEFHYDNASTDVGEFVEIVLDTSVAYDNLSDFTINLYNGNDGTSYNSTTLDQFTRVSTDSSFIFFFYNITGIQNGSPDGICLSYKGTVLADQFISYEGTFEATDGPASGTESTDIGVLEETSTPVGYSLQLAGVGTSYLQFSWQEPDTATPGLINRGQSFGKIKEPTNHAAGFATGAIDGGSIELTWIGSIGPVLPNGYLIIGTKDGESPTEVTDNVLVPNDVNWMDSEAAINVPHVDGANSYTFTNLDGNTEYTFIIYSYVVSGIDIDYKTDGTIPSTIGTTLDGPVIFGFEDFESGSFGAMTPYSVGSSNDWTIVNSAGAENSAFYAQINGYGQTETSNDWLISPGTNLDEYSDDIISFYTQYQYGTDDATNYLRLVYSTNYAGAGDPTLATWTELSFTKPSAINTWTYSGDIDISAIAGENVYFAFHYYSEDDPRRWDVDQIRLVGDEIQSAIPVEKPQTIKDYKLHNNHPNPFNPTTTISFDVPKIGETAELAVYDILGAKIKTLFSGTVMQNQVNVKWDGRNDLGRLMPSGIYFASLRAGSYLQTIKMMMMK